MAAPPPSESDTCWALEFYQEFNTEEGRQNEALDAFELFRDNLNTEILISIKDAHLQTQWLHKQIKTEYLKDLLRYHN